MLGTTIVIARETAVQRQFPTPLEGEPASRNNVTPS
jgi:hypothetical protein